MRLCVCIFVALFFGAAAPANANSEETALAYYEKGVAAYDADDKPLARRAFLQACLSELAEGCAAAGIMAKIGEGGDADNDMATTNFKYACSYGNDDGCAMLGKQFVDSGYTEETAATARTTLLQACAKDMVQACTYYAIFLTVPIGGEQDISGAIDDLNWSCDHGEALACELIATAKEE